MRAWTAALACALVMVLGACGGERPRAVDTESAEGVTADELRAFAGRRVFFAHQSVGGNVLGGLPLAYADQGLTAPPVVETRMPAADGAYLAHTLIGTNGDPLGKIAEFETLLSGGIADRVDVALLKLCYVDVTAATDVDAVFDAYARAMDRIATAHPQLELVYTTVPLTTEPSWKRQVKELLQRTTGQDARDNAARERYNTLVRQRYADSGRLFDIAGVESTAATGGRTTGSRDGAPYYALAAEWASDSGHLNDAGARRVAAELVRVAAG